MDLLFNDLSIHQQFPDRTSFRVAIGRVMAMRATARRLFGRELRCHRNVVNAHVMPNVTIPQALSVNERRAVMQWLANYGPFWDDDRQHGLGDWLDSNGEIITDTGLGEAAYCLLFQGTDCRVVSITPSSWLTAPLSAYWREDDDGRVESVDVRNYWDIDTLKAALTDAPIPLNSWQDLEETARMRCPDLTFSTDSFEPLRGRPFGRGPAKRLLGLLNVLHELKNSFDERGEFNSNGLWLVDQHFSGEKSWFSDSSRSEKAKFANDLSFQHPANPGETLVCTWHGKVKTPQLRIHFSWPIRAAEPLYVMYVGPKITID